MNTYAKLIEIFVTQSAIADAADVSQPFVSLVHKGRRKFGIASCLRLEAKSSGAVTCEDLRPDVDWAYLRGTAKPTKKAA